jgi:hypothetical protein
MDTSNVRIVVTGAYTGKINAPTTQVSQNQLREVYNEIRKAKQ